MAGSAASMPSAETRTAGALFNFPVPTAVSATGEPDFSVRAGDCAQPLASANRMAQAAALIRPVMVSELSTFYRRPKPASGVSQREDLRQTGSFVGVEVEE